MESTQFYLWLPSNSSMDVFPSNTLAEYRVQLPQSIQLVGDWEVALTEIQYPHNWNNVLPKDFNFHFYIYDSSGKPTVYIVQPGYYSTIEALLQAIKTAIDDVKTRNNFKFTYNKISRRVTIEMKNNYEIIFNVGLAAMLGLKPMHRLGKTVTSENIVDLEGAVRFLYVYSDVVQAQIVGDSHVPLIRIIPVEGKESDHVTARFISPQYLQVSRKQFETIEVNIKQDNGEKVPFQSGRVLVTLHFRRANPFFN